MNKSLQNSFLHSLYSFSLFLVSLSWNSWIVLHLLSSPATQLLLSFCGISVNSLQQYWYQSSILAPYSRSTRINHGREHSISWSNKVRRICERKLRGDYVQTTGLKGQHLNFKSSKWPNYGSAQEQSRKESIPTRWQWKFTSGKGTISCYKID